MTGKMSIRRTALAMCIALAMPLCAVAAASSGFSFKGVSWDMSAAQIEKSENAAPDKKLPVSPNLYMVYNNSSFADMPAELTYSFDQDKLYDIRYAITARHADKESYLRDYKKISKALEAKYGKPKSDIIMGTGGKLLEPSADTANMVAKGDATMVTMWELGDTNITQILTGQTEGKDKFFISNAFSFSSKDHSKKILEKGKPL